MKIFDCVIYGSPPSAKNQRQVVKFGGMTRVIKSKKALDYSKAFDSQCPQLDELITCDVSLRVDVWYQSRRPDLACIDIIMDLLQGKVYANDRQVKASMAIWNLDKDNPRALISVKSLSTENLLGLSSLKPSEIWGDLEVQPTESRSEPG